MAQIFEAGALQIRRCELIMLLTELLSSLFIDTIAFVDVLHLLLHRSLLIVLVIYITVMRIRGLLIAATLHFLAFFIGEERELHNVVVVDGRLRIL